MNHLASNAPLINSERLWQSLMDLAQLGATAKGMLSCGVRHITEIASR
jgi:hypothetical protein